MKYRTKYKLISLLKLPLTRQMLIDLVDSLWRDPVTTLRKYRVVPTGVIDNVNKEFTIADNVIPGSEEVFKDGVLQNLTTQYTITYGPETTITMVTAPSNLRYTSVIVVNYSINVV